ncbi:hypothetical protein ACP275_13G192900 [Erythranthe tilingii]
MSIPTRLRTPVSPPLGNLIHYHSPNFLSINLPNSLFAESITGISFHTNGFPSLSHARSSNTTADIDAVEEEQSDFAKLKRKIEALGVNPNSCTPGQYDLLYCPKCEGGKSIQRSLSFHINQNRSYAMWRCFDSKCGWAGQVFADIEKAYPGVNIPVKIDSSRPLTGESLRLEPLGDELFAYFAERMISKETLERNNVMQVAGDRKILAFPYRRNGLFVGCKYRTVEKKFWQEKNAEKILYGLDDITEADEIIIVEGEIDKLSVEEAGYYNCVSVPGGAPQTVSIKELPTPDKDTSFQYLWNCINYLDKASRIILATDGDIPGQALAEELARRLGKERCWLVHWPKKDDVSTCKDANEVLKNLGADALRNAIEKADAYQIPNSD